MFAVANWAGNEFIVMWFDIQHVDKFFLIVFILAYGAELHDFFSLKHVFRHMNSLLGSLFSIRFNPQGMIGKRIHVE